MINPVSENVVDALTDRTFVSPPKALEPTVYAVPSVGVGAVGLVLLTTKYLLGAGSAAVKEPVNEVVPTVGNVNAVGASVGVTQGFK